MSKNFLVYKSSAGSGKTFVLAKSYLKIALSKSSPEQFSQILAITFTVKAAAEMKERIIRYLSEIINATNLGADTLTMKRLLMAELQVSDKELTEKCKALLTAILHNYGQFSVLTIDKFVNRLVRSFAAELGFTSDFEIELDVQRLSTETVEELLLKAGVDPGISKLLLDFLYHQIENDKSWKIETPLALLARHLTSEEFYFQAKKLEGLSPSKVFELKKSLSEQVKEFKKTTQRIGKEALEIVSTSGLSADDFYRKKTGIIGYFEKALEPDLLKLTTPNSYVLATVNDNKWYTGSTNGAIDAIKEKLLRCFNNLQEHLEGAANIKFIEALSTSLFSLGLINELRSSFEVVKEQQNIQMLSDFYQTISTNIIKERAPFIYERIGNRFKHVLIDEFQDTSILQWHTFLPLIQNGLAENHQSMVVGDVKQSIYRFRGGEPALFQSLAPDSELIPPFLKLQIQKETLNFNYRSSPTIIGFNNQLFAELKSTILTEENQDLYEDFFQESVKDQEGWVEAKLLHDDLDDWFDQVIQWIEHNIKDCRYKYEDICLLFHRNDHASAFANALIQEGIPVVSDESLLLTNDPRIQAIITTMEATNNGSDVFVLAKWLAKLDQIGALKGNLHSSIKALKSQKRKDFNKAATLAEIDLQDRKLRAGTTFEQVLSISRALDLDETDPFIRKLLDFALEYEQTAKYLQTPFLNHWQEKGEKLSIDLAAGNAVRVMSIHKSKGLQFPIVILPLLGCKFTKLTNDQLWIDLENKGLGLDTALIDTRSLRSTTFEPLYDAELERSQTDQLNVLYVGLTRAEQKMYLLIKKPESEKHWIEPMELAPLAKVDGWNEESMSLQLGIDRNRE